MADELSEKVKHNLKTICDHFNKEDAAVRERQIRMWRRLKLFWEGFQNVWYSEVAHDWRIYDPSMQTGDDNSYQEYYDKRVNVFRAYLESIIAALSVTVPPIKCYPDNADDTLDLATARAGDKIAQLIYRHNDIPLIWLHALFIYCTEGMVASYIYPKEDKAYGLIKKNKYEEVTETGKSSKCSHCGFEERIDSQPGDPIDMSPLGMSDTSEDEYLPDELMGMDLCPACNQLGIAEVSEKEFTVTRLVGTTSDPKSRVCMEAYGGLYVKVPNYARKQADCPYLELSYETNVVNALARYKHLKKDDFKDKIRSSGSPGGYDSYGQWGRLSPQYQGEYPINNVTMRYTWLRPETFEYIDNKEERDQLYELFPNGVKVAHVNDMFGEACKESLDDHWTLTYNPLADYVHFDPIGLLLTSIQDMTNDIISLTLQTMEHGVGLTFVDPGVVNLNAYNQTQVLPGSLIPAVPKSGKTLNDSFKELKTATLSGEIMPFAQQIQSLGQLVSGALPSLFGGQLEGSETASEYSMSKSQALQRLQNTWKMLTTWHKNVMGKAIPMYIKLVEEDERDVQREKDGSFINVFIKKAELEGKIGKIELEASENLPLNWNQQKDIVMSLLQSNSPQILSWLTDPENLYILKDSIGIDGFNIPGENDREKQHEEIKLLLESAPMQAPPNEEMMMLAAQTGEEPEAQEFPSVEVEPDIDNHEVQFFVCREWLVSEAGRQAKTDNEPGYKNVLLHAKQHLMFIQPPQAPTDNKGAENQEKPTEPSLQEAPIVGDANVTVN